MNSSLRLLPNAALTRPPTKLTPAPITPPMPGIFEATEPIACIAFPTPVLLPLGFIRPLTVEATPLAKPPRPPDDTPSLPRAPPTPDDMKFLVAPSFHEAN